MEYILWTYGIYLAVSIALTICVARTLHKNGRVFLVETFAGHDLVLDGSDNFETRLLVSDAARALGLPSIYAACVGEEGLVAVSLPGATPCLRCYLEVLPPAGSGRCRRSSRRRTATTGRTWARASRSPWAT